jgi:phenylacetic acid degradation operon negative regulatory protein
MTARSVLLSVLLGTDPPRLPVQRLVRTTELFGIAEGTTRTALSRMAAAGEVEAGDGWYAIAADRLLARQARQTASRAARTRPWRGGRWRQAVVVADGRRAAADRAALRTTLAAARLAEQREGVWLRPDNLERATEPAVEELRWSTTVPDGDHAALAAELWDLDDWAARAADLRQRMEATPPSELADGFVLSADILRHLQADPLLPAELLPDGWPGSALRAEYDRYDAAYRAVLRRWFGP